MSFKKVEGKPMRVDVRNNISKSNMRDQDKGPAVDGILIIGEVLSWTAQGRSLPQSEAFHYIEFYELTSDLIEALEPRAIFSPLFCTSFDCMDVAIMLQMIGYQGRYRAMGDFLPNPQLIRTEIRQSCPNIDFDFVNLAGGPRTN